MVELLKIVTSDHKTGEENEVTLVSSKVKLFSLDLETKEWSESSLGTVKLNENDKDDYYRRIGILLFNEAFIYRAS